MRDTKPGAIATRRVVLDTAAAVLGSAVLAGCGLLSKPAAGLTLTKENITIRTLTRATPERAQLMQRGVDEFMQKYPNIRVELVRVPGGEFLNKLYAEIASGDPPHVLSTIDTIQLPDVATKGALRPLDDLVKQDRAFDLKDVFPQGLEASTFKGKLYGIPPQVSGYVLYYNRALFEQAGLKYPPASWEQAWTWDQLLETAQKLTRRDPATGETAQWGLLHGHAPLNMAHFLYQNGAEIVDQPRQPAKAALDQPAAVEALQFYGDLINRQRVLVGPREYAALGASRAFVEGKVAMHVTGRWEVTDLRQRITGFQWDVGALPRKKRPASSMGIASLALVQGAQNPSEAWTWLKFHNAHIHSFKELVEGGVGLQSVARGPLFMDATSPPASDGVFNDAVRYGKPYPVVTTDFTNELTAAVTKIWNGAASARDAVAEALPRLNNLIATSPLR